MNIERKIEELKFKIKNNKIIFRRIYNTYYFNKIQVIVDDKFLIDRKQELCMSVKNNKNKYFIITSRNFESLSNNTKMFFLLHEYAHIFLGHLDSSSLKSNIKRLILNLFNIPILTNNEFADKFAYKVIGKDISVRSLEEVNKIYPSTELETRIKIMKNRK